jgi:hypothetical protein
MGKSERGGGDPVSVAPFFFLVTPDRLQGQMAKRKTGQCTKIEKETMIVPLQRRMMRVWDGNNFSINRGKLKEREEKK